MKKFKIILSFAIVLTMTLLLNATAYAATTNDNDVISSAEEFAAKYNVTTDEALHLSDNLEKAIDKLPTLNAGESATVKVSENLYLEAKTDLVPCTNNAKVAASTTQWTVTGTIFLKNYLNVTIVTLTAVGVFLANGTLCVPTDAYGTYSAVLWSITTASSGLGPAAYNSYARVSFEGQFDLGIDPVSITIQSFSKSCTLYCNAVGGYSTSWN